MHYWMAWFIEGIRDTDLKISQLPIIDDAALLFKWHISMAARDNKIEFLSLRIRCAWNFKC